MSIISKVRNLLLHRRDPAGDRRSAMGKEPSQYQGDEREAREADLLNRILRNDPVSEPVSDPLSTPTRFDVADNPMERKAIAMTDISEFEIPSAILAASLVEKSELKGADLEAYAIKVQRLLINRMVAFRKKKESDSSETETE